MSMRAKNSAHGNRLDYHTGSHPLRSTQFAGLQTHPGFCAENLWGELDEELDQPTVLLAKHRLHEHRRYDAYHVSVEMGGFGGVLADNVHSQYTISHPPTYDLLGNTRSEPQPKTSGLIGHVVVSSYQSTHFRVTDIMEINAIAFIDTLGSI